jgi:hypothetical protein
MLPVSDPPTVGGKNQRLTYQTEQMLSSDAFALLRDPSLVPEEVRGEVTLSPEEPFLPTTSTMSDNILTVA